MHETTGRRAGLLRATLQSLWGLGYDTLGACVHTRVVRLAAALAFYALFSLAPLLVIATAGLRLALGERADEAVVHQVAAVVGAEGAAALQTLLNGVALQAASFGTTLIGAVGLLLGGSALFNHLKDSLNTIWEVIPRAEHGARRFVIDRWISLVLTFCVGVLALVGVTLSVELEAVAGPLFSALALPWGLVRAAQLLVAVVVVLLLVALTFWLLPDAHASWRDILVGAAVTAALLVASQALLGLYLRSSLVRSAYGVIGAVVVLLTWAYGAGVIYFVGAAFTRVYANRHGARISPAPHALAVTAGDRAVQGLLRAEELAAQEREPGEAA
ncbi:MAG: YihY/virulence factor BrkB family protein [Chloroflexales bacterium]|nr:YihY/virulence factor BrkB family protein [Chloroflexales bacterium]